MADKPSVLREVDAEALALARRLVRSARSVSLAVIDAASGFPAVSRALTATDFDGVPVILVSALAAHTQSLLADSRCSLLAGEIGKGDPLAHPRITLFATAEAVARDSEVHGRLRSRFLARHPKAGLYIDFPDFRFFRLFPNHASLNGGFGRAYAIDGNSLIIAANDAPSDWLKVQERIMTTCHDTNRLAMAVGAPKSSNYRLCGIDAAGIDLASGSVSFRYEFPCGLIDSEAVDAELVRLLDGVCALRKI